MKATWGETSDEESEVEDGDNDNLALMDKSDTDSDNDSSEIYRETKMNNMKLTLFHLQPNRISGNTRGITGNYVRYGSL
ncbi:hypothetical protein HAX54_037666 [Datura stramonium]|uniref:Uncharacterized protein n=1 Tax=Datura stramonium TaxID=4076 RepID=A0ABS8VKY1_DATST|nr:hypothetical protein [Datura stramonium]